MNGNGKGIPHLDISRVPKGLRNAVQTRPYIVWDHYRISGALGSVVAKWTWFDSPKGQGTSAFLGTGTKQLQDSNIENVNSILRMGERAVFFGFYMTAQKPYTAATYFEQGASNAVIPITTDEANKIIDLQYLNSIQGSALTFRVGGANGDTFYQCNMEDVPMGPTQSMVGSQGAWQSNMHLFPQGGRLSLQGDIPLRIDQEQIAPGAALPSGTPLILGIKLVGIRFVLVNKTGDEAGEEMLKQYQYDLLGEVAA